MKKTVRITGLVLACAMLLSLSAFAGGAPLVGLANPRTDASPTS